MKKLSWCLLLMGGVITAGLPWSLAHRSPGSSHDNFLHQRPFAGRLRAGAMATGLSPQSVGADHAPSLAPTVPAKGTLSETNAARLAQASALPRKRTWDAAFLTSLGGLKSGDPIQFELVAGEMATGTVQLILRSSTEVIHIAGRLTMPETGQFFFQKQTIRGVAGDFVGVVEFPGSKTAYRIEPTGPGGSSELLERPLEAVICYRMPRAPPALASAPATANIPPLKPGDFPDLPIPPYQNGIAVLQSLPGATAVIYLDFQGGYTTNWGGITYARPDVSNGQIRDVWVRVAEDYMPFKINVTTDLGVFQAAPEGSRQRVIITTTDTAAPGQGGIAEFGSFNWSGDYPCWVFETSGKPCAEACSHEAGHTLGLSHSGQIINGQLYDYFSGQGSGETGWAPIMGVGYYKNVVQWSKGEYVYANNQEDMLAIITSQNNNVAYRPDDTGDTLATSRYLEIYTDYTASAEGVIERTGDTDAFQFTTSGGAVSLRADPVSASPNLAIQVMLYDAAETLIASNNPQDTLWASLTTNLPAGTYTFRVTGAGRNDPARTGFSDYGSLGYYSITGSVANARLTDRFAIPETATNGTVVGTIAANNPNNDPLSFTILSGNTGNTFALNDAGVLSVADNSLLDYGLLGRNSQLPVQFELFVNITNTAHPSLTEINRRVVVAIVHVPQSPMITCQPQSLSVPAGTNASFVVAAKGTVPYDNPPFRFQWFFNGASIVGATGSTLAFTDVQAPDAGDYFVTVSTSASSVTSTVATLTVDPRVPFIILQPVSQAAFVEFDVGFTVAATGTEPLTCQWKQNGVDIPGATQTTLHLNPGPLDGGIYQAVFSNSVGSTVSAEALLAIVPVAAWGWNEFGQTNLPLALTNAVQISAGGTGSVALRRDGSVVAWGYSQPDVPFDLTNAVAVRAGRSHNLALRDDGTVVAWGANSFGETNVPAGLTNVVAIAAGRDQSLALKSDGNVAAWGSGPDATVPDGLSNVIAIAVRAGHSLALKADGTVVGWGGDNSYGQTAIPTNLVDVVAIAAGAFHNLALRSDGTVVAWGDNEFGQTNVPPGLSKVMAIAAGDYHSLALRSDGTMVAWGAGTNSLIYPQFGQSIIPPSVTNLSAISGGEGHTLALAASGPPFITEPPTGRFAYMGARVLFRAVATGALPLAYQWQCNGTNIPGATNQLLVLNPALDSGSYRVAVTNSLGSATSHDAQLTFIFGPPLITAQPLDQTVSVGSQATLRVTAVGSGPLTYQWRFNGLDLLGATNSALVLDHVQLNQKGAYSVLVRSLYGEVSSAKATLTVLQVVGWGDTYSGQCATPAGLEGVVRVAGGGYHSLALEADGTVVAWGASAAGENQNNYGQCTVPTGLTEVVDIAAGLYHSLALKADGTVIAWGAGASTNSYFNNYGQSMVPAGLKDIVGIAAGDYHSVAVAKDGRVVVWGGYPRGSVTNIPPAATNVVAISSRGNNVLALKADGTLVQWGTFPWTLSTNAVAIAAGALYELALGTDGQVRSWHDSYAVPAGLVAVVQIAAGYQHSLALKNDGTVVTWGLTNQYGLGNVPSGLARVIDVAGGDFHTLAAVGDGRAIIKVPPMDRAAFQGGTTLLTVMAAGDWPLAFQWQFNGTNLPLATNAWLQLSNLQVSAAGTYRVIVSNVFNSVTSAPAAVEVRLPVPGAVDAPQLTWASSGNNVWFGQTNICHDGISAAQSGAIAGGQQCSLQTTVSGPGQLSFWWKVSCEDVFDYLAFYMDGTKQGVISGEEDWQLRAYDVPSGAHTLTWTYAKDPTVSAGLDAGWLDQVVFVTNPPVITQQPQSTVVAMGQPLGCSVKALGAPPLLYQWLKNGTNLSGATRSSWNVAKPTRHDSGVYAVIVTNPGGSVLSSNADVRVLIPQKLNDAGWLADGSFVFASRDADGAALLRGDLAGFEPQVSTNLLDWEALPTSPVLTNGMLLILDPGATNYPTRFYRVIER